MECSRKKLFGRVIVPNVEYHGSIGTHTGTTAQIQFRHRPGPDTTAQIQFRHRPDPGVAAVIRSGMPVALVPLMYFLNPSPTAP